MPANVKFWSAGTRRRRPISRAFLRGRLFSLLKNLSFRRAAVRLASGRESNFYFDMKPAMLHPEAVGLMTTLVLDEIKGLNADFIGGLVMGAVPLVAPVVMDSPKFGKPLSALRSFGVSSLQHPQRHDVVSRNSAPFASRRNTTLQRGV